MIEIAPVRGVSTAVGEGPVWDPSTQSLWFIDLIEECIQRLDPDGAVTTFPAPGSPAAVAPAADGRLAVALADGFCWLSPASGEFGPVTPARCHPDARMSEGKVDRQGRFLALSGDRRFAEPLGLVHRWDDERSVSILDGGFILGNGPCWSPDGRIMYVADSVRGVVWQYDYDLDDGAMRGRREFASMRGASAFPDGASVDSAGCLWVVMHRSPHLVRFRPDGREDRRVRMPTPHISSIAFGGPDLDVAFVTSLDPRRIPGAAAGEQSGEVGLLYRVTGLNVTGLADAPVRTFTTG